MEGFSPTYLQRANYFPHMCGIQQIKQRIAIMRDNKHILHYIKSIDLLSDARQIIDEARSVAYSAINLTLVQRGKNRRFAWQPDTPAAWGHPPCAGVKIGGTAVRKTGVLYPAERKNAYPETEMTMNSEPSNTQVSAAFLWFIIEKVSISVLCIIEKNVCFGLLFRRKSVTLHRKHLKSRLW